MCCDCSAEIFERHGDTLSVSQCAPDRKALLLHTLRSGIVSLFLRHIGDVVQLQCDVQFISSSRKISKLSVY